MSLTRRRFVLGSSGLVASGSLSACARAVRGAAAPGLVGLRHPFRHGVASGDPLADRVLLWTRISTALSDPVEVHWLAARDPRLEDVVASGRTLALAEHDYTVTIDVDGLEPGAHYYYRFAALGFASPVGRTKTLPIGHVRSARFAVASCSNYGWGFFNGYRCIAEIRGLDAVLHLGDYIYEYEVDAYDNARALGRLPDPPDELLTLSDYRRRYAQYRSDPDLQEVHRLHPFVTVWDDHESANNSHWLGAENHNERLAEGRWAPRRDAAIKAYFEWIPIRRPSPWDSHPARIYRTFRFGDLLDLTMLDGRMIGRDPPVSWSDVEAVTDPERSMLGQVQERYLERTLARSEAAARWRLLGQQTMLGQRRKPNGKATGMDSWSGYPAARQRFFDTLEKHSIDNLVVLTGDLHSSWALELARDPWSPRHYDPASGRGALGVELICPGITSPSRYREPERARAYAEYCLSSHPHVKLQEAIHRGYVLVDVRPERIEARWRWLPTVDRRSSEQFTGAAFAIDAGRAHLRAL